LNSSDIPFIIKDIKNKMPFHTDNTGKIPYTFKPLPKSFMEESHKVDNKFLNNHLSEIEEAVDKKLMEKNSFINQQVMYHKESGILNHDNFFNADLASGLPIGIDNFKHYPFLINPYIISTPCTHGSEVQVDGSPATYNTSQDTLYGYKITGAEADKCYDEIAQKNYGVVAGSGRFGMYVDNPSGVSNPDALLIDLGTFAHTSGYTYHVGAEWTQDGTSNVWVAHNDNDSANRRVEMTGGDRRYKGGVSFGALPDPFDLPVYPAGYDTYPSQMKISHS